MLPLRQVVNRAYKFLFPARYKRRKELEFWCRWKLSPGFGNSHYVDLYTAHFGLDLGDYAGKRLLDIGCGPMGSLEWAEMAAARIGLDPLAKDYLKLGAHQDKMQYVAAPSEAMHFADDYFDIISSFNSLDHVDDLAATIKEIQRVLKPGGLFLLITDVNHEPTDCEPQRLSWDILEAFRPGLARVEERHYERRSEGIYASLGCPYDHTDPTSRGGVLSAKLRKVRRR
ncbi:MAG: class I SAM-dependent methyltransferase [Thermodesulfobacteriota bacterium]